MKPCTAEEKKRTVLRAIVCGFLLAALASLLPFAASSEELPQHVVRLHVIANSDSERDQAIKLKVRDAVLKKAEPWIRGAETMEEANAALCVHLEALREAANEALRQNGALETAQVQVTDQYFPTREYDAFSLPAGKYRTLLVTIGEGKGKNWWCVVFPALCLPAAEEKPEDALSLLPESQRELVKNPQKYKVKFKAVELYEELKKWLEL